MLISKSSTYISSNKCHNTVSIIIQTIPLFIDNSLSSLELKTKREGELTMNYDPDIVVKVLCLLFSFFGTGMPFELIKDKSYFSIQVRLQVRNPDFFDRNYF